jgi:hypothetical protein
VVGFDTKVACWRGPKVFAISAISSRISRWLKAILLWIRAAGRGRAGAGGRDERFGSQKENSKANNSGSEELCSDVKGTRRCTQPTHNEMCSWDTVLRYVNAGLAKRRGCGI